MIFSYISQRSKYKSFTPLQIVIHIIFMKDFQIGIQFQLELQAMKRHILFVIMQLHKLHNFEICRHGNQNENKKLLVFNCWLKFTQNVVSDNSKIGIKNCNAIFQNNKQILQGKLLIKMFIF